MHIFDYTNFLTLAKNALMISGLKLPIITNLESLQQDIINLSKQTIPGSENLVLPKELHQTSFINECSSVSNLIESINCSVLSVKILTVTTGATTTNFYQQELSLEKEIIQLYVPVFSNEAVKFQLENDDIITIEEGDCWYINTLNHKAISNNGVSDLICLVITCITNDWLEDMFFETSNSDKVKYLNELRDLNTVDSNRMADSIEHSLWLIS